MRRLVLGHQVAGGSTGLKGSSADPGPPWWPPITWCTQDPVTPSKVHTQEATEDAEGRGLLKQANPGSFPQA